MQWNKSPRDRTKTGGAQTLEDIMARQRGEKVDNSFRSNATGDPNSAAGMANQLGTLGGTSDPELWRSLRFGSANVTSTYKGPTGTVLVQDGGMRWLTFRDGPLSKYGLYLLLGTFSLLALFYLIRGKIRIDGEKTGRTLVRFKAIERFWPLVASWLLFVAWHHWSVNSFRAQGFNSSIWARDFLNFGCSIQMGPQ